MKRAGKVISYLLAFVMFTTVFSGLKLEKTPASAAETKSFTVLEIVPDKAMGTFGYLVDGYFGMGLSEADDLETITSLYTGNASLRNYLIANNFCENKTDKFVSKNYFVNNVLKKNASDTTVWNVTVNTKTPKTLLDSDISSADMIVINETVPSKHGEVIATNIKFDDLADTDKLTSSQVLKIFKKIAGADGTSPVPYIVDFSLYDGASCYDTRSKTGKFGYNTADHIHILGKGDIESEYVDLGSGEYLGSDRNTFKLYKLLSCMDPATLYGLYFTENDGSYGVDDKLNLIHVYLNDKSKTSRFNLGGKSSVWTDAYFRPNYLRVSNDYNFLNTIKTKLGWFEVDTMIDDGGKKLTKHVDDFSQKIGGEDGRGLVYKDADGILESSLYTKLKPIVQSFSGVKNDYHPYRFLVITDGEKNDYVDSTVNRSLIADMVKEANSEGLGLVGGIVIECISKYAFENLSANIEQTYDAVCKDCNLMTEGNKKWNNIPSDMKVEFSKNGLVNKFKSLLGNSFGLAYKVTPQEYYLDFQISYKSENGWEGYQNAGNLKVAGNKNYINSDSHPAKTLDFKFDIVGSGNYTVDVYVDANRNDIFESAEKKSYEANGNTEFEKNIKLSEFFDKEYAGGFAWKLVVTKSGGDSISRVGYSALRKSGDKKQLIKVLQIYPTDYAMYYASAPEDNDTIWSNPLLILPNKYEVKAAESAKGSIKEYIQNTSSDAEDGSGKGLNGLMNYFANYISIDVVTSSSATGSESKNKTINSVSHQPVGKGGSYLDADGNKQTVDKRQGILTNSAFLYYYLAKLEGYEIDVTRYSVYSYNQAIANKDVIYNPKTHKIDYAIKNADDSTRYYYTSDELKLAENWKEEKVGSQQKYLYEKISDKDLIYGYRQGSEERYYGSEVGDAEGTRIYDDEDLLVLGFGLSMDYMSDGGISVIKSYMTNGGAVFAGNGTVNRSGNNTLGADEDIRSLLGMQSGSSGYTSGYDLRAEDVPTMMITNDTLFSHFPYVVNHFFKATAASKQPFKLDLSKNDIVVSFAKYMTDDGNYGNWGDAEQNYYLYKKGNITFCGFGNNYPKQKLDQVGGVMTMAETVMIVNALVTTAKSASDPEDDDPWFQCKDVDSSILTEKKIEDGVEKYVLTDSVYTDYDAFGISETYKNSLLFGTIGSDPVKSGSDQIADASAKLEGFTDPEKNIRYIPYYAKFSGEVYVDITDLDGSKLDLDMYELVSVSTTKSEYQKMTPVDNGEHSNRYRLTKNKSYYYLAVPLTYKDSKYNGSELGFSFEGDYVDEFKIKLSLKQMVSEVETEIEYHTVDMVRRVLYPVK